eukprot:7309435-Prymnesium_polylepis.2
MTFLCVPIEYDHAAGDVHRYVHDHLDLNCDNEEYSRTSELAYFMVAVWPLGLPFLYALLLGASHRALSVGNGKMTQMGRMTAFLWDDYHPHSFWWELVELGRKLALTGE